MLLIFQALEAILLRTVSNLSHFSVVGMNIVKKLINSYVKLIYAALYSENCKMSRGCLTLLSAMVAQGPDSARDVCSHFDFNNKYLPGLLKKGFKKGRTDVRMACIQFALSFLVAGDNALLAQAWTCIKLRLPTHQWAKRDGSLQSGELGKYSRSL
ncbi:nucleolar pre-ribosomal-associated protein 1-like isoform 2-T10 [Acridotheres tristis]